MPCYILAVFWLSLPLYGIVDHDFYCATLLLLPPILDIDLCSIPIDELTPAKN